MWVGGMVTQVAIKRGSKKEEGKVVQVYRKKWAIHVERVAREKNNGTENHGPAGRGVCCVDRGSCESDGCMLASCAQNVNHIAVVNHSLIMV